MTIRTRTLIIGAGQAGLALSRCLTVLDHEHLLVDRGRVAERWRSERWDSFRLLTPNYQTRLPGHRYAGCDPDGFMDRRQIVDFFDDYARSFSPPVHTGVTVASATPAGNCWLVDTDEGLRFRADNVVVATGNYDRPAIPDMASALPTGIRQIHTTAYRNPDALPDGAVLVVGSGPSGQQIADELVHAGRRVYLATGRHRPLPRRYRGQDVYWWMDHMGMLDRTVDSLPAPTATRHAPSVVLAGEARDMHLRRLVASGVVPAGRLTGIDGQHAYFAGDLAERLAEADHNVSRLRGAVDDYVRQTGLTAPVEDPPPPAPAPWAVKAPRRLDLRAASVTTVVWATGQRRDYSWVNAPVFDSDDEPMQRRGVTPAAGLYFLGLRWMYRRKSNSIDGVGDDAEHLAEILTRDRVRMPNAGHPAGSGLTV